jgi:transcriptional regulator with XRE-family HTH domain
MKMKPDYCGELASAVKERLGFTQKEMAEYFGISLNAWQKKEQEETRLSVAEQYYFQLLLNRHPDYLVVPRVSRDDTPIHKASLAAVELAQYLSGRMPMPSEVNALQSVLVTSIQDFNKDWKADIDGAVGAALPDENEVLRQKLKDAQEEIAALRKQLKNK